MWAASSPTRAAFPTRADSDGTLYAGGAFSDLGDIDAADRVAFLPSGGTWQPMGAGAGPCGCAVTSFVRGLAAVGTDVYVGSRGRDRDERPVHRTEYGVRAHSLRWSARFRIWDVRRDVRGRRDTIDAAKIFTGARGLIVISIHGFLDFPTPSGGLCHRSCGRMRER